MVVAGLIKELLISSVVFDVILAGGHVKVRDPCQLTIYVSLLTA